MGFKDKAKEIIDNVVDRVKDPDGSLVEKTWPAAEPPVSEGETSPEAAEGADPDLDSSTEDQYKKDEQ